MEREEEKGVEGGGGRKFELIKLIESSVLKWSERSILAMIIVRIGLFGSVLDSFCGGGGGG